MLPQVRESTILCQLQLLVLGAQLFDLILHFLALQPEVILDLGELLYHILLHILMPILRRSVYVI